MKASPLSPRNSPGFPSRKEGWIAGKGSVPVKEATVSIPGRQRRNKEGAMTLARPRHSGTVKLFHGYPRTLNPWCNFQLPLQSILRTTLLTFRFRTCFKCCNDAEYPRGCPENSPTKRKYHLGPIFKLLTTFYLIYLCAHLCLCVHVHTFAQWHTCEGQRTIS